MSQNSSGAKAARRAFVLQGRFRRFFSNLGPGLITGAADDDPSGIATYSVTGASFGYSLLWTAILSFPLMAAVQIMCARLGMVTGLGLAGVIRVRYPRWILWGACALLAHRQYRQHRRGSRRHGGRHAASDRRQAALLDARVRAPPGMACCSGPVIASSPGFSNGSRSPCLPTSLLHFSRTRTGPPSLRATLIPHVQWTARVLGDAGRHPGNHHLAVPLLLAGRGGS